MDPVLLAARLVLAAVLLVAAAGKLADRRGSREAVAAFGVPVAVAGPVAALLPLVEGLAAALLLPASTATAGAALALALMAAFSLGIFLALARGERPDCHCFGALHSTPAGPAALGRNAGLGALAALVFAAGPGPSAVAWIGDLDRGEALGAAGLAVAVASAAAFAALALALLRRHGSLLLRIDELETRLAQEGIDVRPEPPALGLPAGDPAPVDALPGLEALLDGDRDVLLVFTHPDCGPCREMKPEVDAWRASGDRLHVVTVGPDGDLLDPQDRSHDAFGLGGTPGAVLVASDGTIASPAAAGADAVRALREDALLAARRPRPGDALDLPPLRGLDGEPVSLDGEATLLLWNPECGFCAELRGTVRAAEKRGHPLVVVSSGDPESTLAEGFASPVALDPDFRVGDALHATGTPAAAAVRDGRLASGVRVGVDEVRGAFGGLALSQH